MPIITEKNDSGTPSSPCSPIPSPRLQSPINIPIIDIGNDKFLQLLFNVIGNGLKSAFQEKGSGLGTTYGGAFPNFQIDYILCDPAMDVLNYKIIKKKYSDHYPVVADIQYNK